MRAAAAVVALALAACAPLPPAGDAPIPAGLQGRWGLVPADCDPARDDAKGLMTVGPDTLRFYEARARVAAITARSPDRLAARFAFEGEGTTWTREIDFRLVGGGERLIRNETGPDAMPGPLTYRRCP